MDEKTFLPLLVCLDFIMFVLMVNDYWVFRCNCDYFFSERSLLGILQVGGIQITHNAFVDWIICATPRGSFFILCLCFLLCLHPQRRWADAHDHQGDQTHGNWAAPKWVPPWAPSPFSLGEMPWLLSDFVLELRALSSCWDCCLCNDDKGLWVINDGFCRKSFNTTIMNVVQPCCNFVINVTPLLFPWALNNRWTPEYN